MKEINSSNFVTESKKVMDMHEENPQFASTSKGYFEFLQEAKSRQRDVEEPSNANRVLWDDSDYNAIFMTF